MRLIPAAVALGAVTFAIAGDGDRKYRDPAPPILQVLPPVAVPKPQPNSDVTFHSKPKPLATGAVTEDWPSFRGPTHNSISTETKLLHNWPKGGPKLVWELKKDTSYSSPAISGDRLVMLHRVGDEERVECLHRETGERYWKFSYPTHFEDRYGYNNGPRSSPVIDGDRVYTIGAEGRLHCFKLETGQVYWKRDLRGEFKVPQDFFGIASTPLIDGDLLIVNVGAPGGPSVAAFDKKTGKLVWGAGDQWGPSYASPVPANVNGHRRIFVFAGGESRPPTGGLMSIDPQTGAVDFSFPWRSKSYESVNAASPVVIGSQVFISASYKTGGALLNLLPTGGQSVAWTTQDLSTHFNTAIYKDGYLYGFDGRNEPDASLVCLELKTGKVMWRVNPEWEESIVVDGAEHRQTLGTFRGTLLWADGKFLCLGEFGHLLWLDLTPKGYKELARAWLFAARETWALPVLSHGLLYINQNTRDVMRHDPPRLLCSATTSAVNNGETRFAISDFASIIRRMTLRMPLLPLLFASLLPAQTPDRPISALPYAPSLDLTSMDRSVNPCTNFYAYSCGNWIKKNPIPPDQARWDVYSKLTQDNLRFLWGILEEASKPGPNRSAEQRQIGDYFAACMDEAAVEKAGAGPLRPALDQIAALQSVADLAGFVARQHMDSHTSMLFGFGSNQDYADASRVIAFATAGGLGLPDRDYYVKTDSKSVATRQKYLEHVQRMFELLGDSPAAAKAGASAVMEIETALAKASLTRVDKRDPYKLFHKLSLEQVQALTPSFPWNRYLAGVGLASASEINVTEPDFFKQLEKELASQNLAAWKTYLRWHLVHAHARYLSTPFVQANFDFYSKYLRGVTEQQPRWKRCVQYVDHDLGEALGKVFVEKTLGPDVKQRTLAMTKEIQKAMEADLEQIPWMNAATKKQALDKLHGMIDKVGYPDKWRDYSSVRISRNSFLDDVSHAVEFESKRQISKIGRPLDRGEWQMTPPTVNAYYDPQMNDINFPAGVLQPPLFDPKMDEAPNYGNTGATIGHELTHGFDDEGRQFDAKGNLRDWWTEEDAREFKERAKCVSDQYSHYTVIDDIKINSKLTLGEDVADLGGTILAYMAWKDATRGRSLAPVDGLSPDQRFFIGMAQWACGDERPESKRVHAITDPHSPEEYRINGVVSNMPEFRTAFSCKLGQPMAPEKACRVW